MQFVHFVKTIGLMAAGLVLLARPALAACDGAVGTRPIPLPIYATLPNEGSTFGFMPVFLRVCEATGRTESILAPSVSYNDTFNDWAAISEGTYLLRSNIDDWSDEQLWKAYIQLTQAEAAFRIQKDQLNLRPIWHQREDRVQAHILVCFLAFVLWKSLEMWQSRAGLGNSPRTILEEIKRIQSQDVVLPTAAHGLIRSRTAPGRWRPAHFGTRWRSPDHSGSPHRDRKRRGIAAAYAPLAPDARQRPDRTDRSATLDRN